MHELKVVMIKLTASWTKTSPGGTFTVLLAKVAWWKKHNKASPGRRTSALGTPVLPQRREPAAVNHGVFARP